MTGAPSHVMPVPLLVRDIHALMTLFSPETPLYDVLAPLPPLSLSMASGTPQGQVLGLHCSWGVVLSFIAMDNGPPWNLNSRQITGS
jgi:hypothetical protein